MALRISASGQALSSTANLPGANGFTITCWFYMVTDRNAASGIFGVSGTTGIFICTDSTGTAVQMRPTGGGGTSSAAGFPNFSTTTWYALALAVDVAGDGTIYHRTATTTALTTGNVNTTNLAGATTWRIGQWDATSADWANARFAAVKCYTNKLTTNEIIQELSCYLPCRTVDLAKWSPFLSADNKDYSGNGGDWTGTGATTEAGPPIPWRYYDELTIPWDGSSPVWYVVYETSTGALYSVGQVYDLPSGYSVKTYYGVQPDQVGYEWDPVVLDFVHAPGAGYVDRVQDLLNEAGMSAVWADLSGGNSSTLQTRIATLLGSARYRLSDEAVDLP